jgi:hypothetical protein
MKKNVEVLKSLINTGLKLQNLNKHENLGILDSSSNRWNVIVA